MECRYMEKTDSVVLKHHQHACHILIDISSCANKLTHKAKRPS